MYKILKNYYNLSTVNWTFFIIIQYTIFMKIIAINDNEIFHVKDKELLSTIWIWIRTQSWKIENVGSNMAVQNVKML